MDPFKLINKYHKAGSEEYNILVVHSVLVTKKALTIAKRVNRNKLLQARLLKEKSWEEPDLQFIYEAALLHDIGFGFPYVKGLKNRKKISGSYIAHGYWGAEILRSEELKRHAKVAENHIGVGLTKEEVKRNKWPIPVRDYCPKTPEEVIISYADLFYSKSLPRLFRVESKEEIKREIENYGSGKDKIDIFLRWDKALG